MKIRTEDNLILTNSNNEKKFTIQASAKAFQILSSALYSRKVEAIVRELSCNAHDSHVQAGYPERPFVVHLPNSWEPEFYVEDFGIGLDADDVENIYTSYFTSTKTESNDVIGGFGLGSKTPFSYCDSFNIRARKNGFEYHFNAFINMQGEPATSLLSKSETEEPNGVRVTVPVKTADFNQFATDAAKVYKWFTVVPDIVGNTIIIDNAKALRLAKDGSFWSTYSKDGWERNAITAVMGNVAYLVPNVAETFAAHFNNSEQSFFKNNTLYVRFEIGDLDVAASRETISFDEETEKQFIQRVKDVINQFCADTQTKLDTDITNVPDAIALVKDDVGIWANAMFTYGVESIDVHSGSNFITAIRQAFIANDHANNTIDSYYFAKNRHGNVKRHALDYIRDMTFAKLDQRRIVILQGSDQGFQRIARKEANEYSPSELFGVFFVEKIVDQDVQDALTEVFGDYIKFEVAADLLAIDKAERKAARDAAKLLQGPTVRAKAANRIGADSVRVKLFTLSKDPVTGAYSSTFEHDKVITADAVKDKKFIVLKERYGEGYITTLRPSRTLVGDAPGHLDGKEFEQTVETTSESALYNFCRVFKLDAVIIIRSTTEKKAEKMFGASSIKILDQYDQDFIKAVTLKHELLPYQDEVNLETMLEAHTEYGARRFAAELKERAEQYIAANPTGTLAKALDLIAPLTTMDSIQKVPQVVRFLASDKSFNPKTRAAAATAVTLTIYTNFKKDFPMVFDHGSTENVEQYVYQMNKLRELNLFKEVVATEE